MEYRIHKRFAGSTCRSSSILISNEEKIICLNFVSLPISFFFPKINQLKSAQYSYVSDYDDPENYLNEFRATEDFLINFYGKSLFNDVLLIEKETELTRSNILDGKFSTFTLLELESKIIIHSIMIVEDRINHLVNFINPQMINTEEITNFMRSLCSDSISP